MSHHRRLEQPRFAHERDDIRVRLDVLVTIAVDASALGVDEVGGQVATDVFEAVIEHRLNVLHLTVPIAYLALTGSSVNRSVTPCQPDCRQPWKEPQMELLLALSAFIVVHFL